MMKNLGVWVILIGRFDSHWLHFRDRGGLGGESQVRGASDADCSVGIIIIIIIIINSRIIREETWRTCWLFLIWAI